MEMVMLPLMDLKEKVVGMKRKLKRIYVGVLLSIGKINILFLSFF